MADNVTLNSGSGGATLATDDITDAGGAHYQRIKLTDGTANSETHIHSGNGTASNSLRVTVASDSTGLLTVDGNETEDAAVNGSPILAGGRYDATERTLDDGDAGAFAITANGHVLVDSHNVVSTNNSTTSTLLASATYTGTGEDVSNYSSVTIMVDASHDSGTDGMTFQFSTDNSNWDDVYLFTYTAADGARRFQFPVTGQYFRFVYTNGGTNQTHFRAQTILHQAPITSTVHRIVDTIDPDRSSTLTKAAIIAQINGTGDFTPIQSTAAGILKIGGSVDIDDISASTQTNPIRVEGEETENAAVAGNPVLIGGRYDAVDRTLNDGDSGAVALDVNGHVITSPHAESLALSDNVSNTVNIETDHSGGFIAKGVFPYYFDGSTWDRARGDSTNGLLVNLGSNNDVSINAGTNVIGDVGISGARTSGGTTLYRNVDVDETEDAIKASAGQLYWVHAMNLTAAVLYLQFYNATVGNVTVGTTTPDLTFPLATQGDTNGAGFVLAIPNGIEFDTAITIACTTTFGGSSGPAANGVFVNAGYA